MNPHGEENSFCYLHPKELLVGVCALCLKERLLSLAEDANGVFRRLRRKHSIAFPKVFALSSFFHRFEARTQKQDEEISESSITSLEDSFISIKFEGDGRGSWESMKRSSEGQSWFPSGRGDKFKENVNKAVEKAMLHGGSRWRKKFGLFIALGRSKRFNNGGTSHAGIVRKVERVRERRGWIRSLTRRTMSTRE